MTSTFSQPLSFSQASSCNNRSHSRKWSTSKGSSYIRGVSIGSQEKSASWVESWAATRANLSNASVKRSVASSPTESKTFSPSNVPERSFNSPSQVVLGFDVPASDINPGLNLKHVSANSGLLSKAFVPRQDEFLLSPVSEASTLPIFHPRSNEMFFPDVDLSLLLEAQERNSIFKTELVANAFMLASRAHAGQYRKDGASELSHCLLVALSLADLGLDESTVAAGLLHESLRQNGALRSQLEEFMSSEVVQLVDRVTTISEISQLYRNHRDEVNDERLRRMMLAMEDVRAVLIKLACRVHNMKTLSALSEDKQRAFAQETLDIFAVVANRLGCWSLKAELEDLSFAVLYPEQYSQVKCMVSSRQDSAALEATVQAIKAGLEEKDIQYEEISGRPKNLYGIWQKMIKNNESNVDRIYDVIALRVVVSGNKHDCYQAQRVVQGLYRCMPERSKDFIRVTKKANGYQSLHETIYGEEEQPIEVQIRTSKMHYIAEYGFAAHWKYKESSSSTDDWLDKEVQYKKWLMSYGLGIHDKKIRPVGSPPTDSSLKSLGAAYLEPSSSGRPSGMRSHSAPGRVDPFLRHDRFKLEQPAPRSVVTVVLQTQDNVQPKEVNAGLTAQQLAAQLAVEHLPGYVMMLNQRVVFPSQQGSAATPLKDGDLVQVLPLSQVILPPPEGLQGGENTPPRVISFGEVESKEDEHPVLSKAQSYSLCSLPRGIFSSDELDVFSLHSPPSVLALNGTGPAPSLQVMASPAVPVGGY